MNDANLAQWQRFQQYYTEYPGIGLAIDISKMTFTDEVLSSLKPRLARAFDEMNQLERGAIANPDEKRMVGHYWLRNASLAPTPEIGREITETIAAIKTFTARVHAGTIRGASGPFKNVLLIGIGGSALGPQFVANALGHPSRDKMTLYFFDNTDPDGMDRVLSRLHGDLGRTLCIIISKSGGTKETRNGMLEAEAAFQAAKLKFGAHAVAVTSKGSELDKYAVQNNWLERFPMWDWVGGRTSELSAVGLLPAALQGLDIEGMLEGAKKCDELTRKPDFKANPAAQLAALWFCSGNGKGDKNLIILPYKDRLELFSKYLQQLIMESLGKATDRDGKAVHQGITVLGNKGSTDQHAYVQQLRDGRNDFFLTFIEVLRDRDETGIEVEPGVTSGDYLNGFFQGTRRALFEGGRDSITLTLREVTPFSVGMLIALFERTVGLYASIINVNAYHQPGVEAGKKAAGEVIKLQIRIAEYFRHNPQGGTAQQIAAALGNADPEAVFKICQHLAANGSEVKCIPGTAAGETRFAGL